MQNDEERGTEKTWGTHLQRDLFFSLKRQSKVMSL
jgi:hypothetical protein